MRQFSTSPVEMFSCLWRNRELIYVSAKREVYGRYRGSTFGMLWSLFNPLLMLVVYTFIFSVVFNARWRIDSESKTEFALVLFAGLIVFNLFSECINRAPSIIISNANYVKKVVYPLEILPFIVLLSALYHTFISLVVWMVAYMLLHGVPHITILYLPVIFAPFCLFIMGLSWVLSSLGVYLRDVSQVIGILTTVLMFMSPIFFPASALPESYRHLIYLNPLTPVIEQTRDVLFWGHPPDFYVVGIYGVVTLGISWLGFVWFQKTRMGFADVM